MHVVNLLHEDADMTLSEECMRVIVVDVQLVSEVIRSNNVLLGKSNLLLVTNRRNWGTWQDVVSLADA